MEWIKVYRDQNTDRDHGFAKKKSKSNEIEYLWAVLKQVVETDGQSVGAVMQGEIGLCLVIVGEEGLLSHGYCIVPSLFSYL